MPDKQNTAGGFTEKNRFTIISPASGCLKFFTLHLNCMHVVSLPADDHQAIILNKAKKVKEKKKADEQ